MSDTDRTVINYIAMWNETDPHRRRELVSETLADDASYLDPITAGNGSGWRVVRSAFAGGALSSGAIPSVGTAVASFADTML